MANRTPMSEALQKFLKTTTLHGFKYLSSKYLVDRIIWLLCCLASACCAAVLCAVLWARFLKVPALLAVQDVYNHTSPVYGLPMLAVCPAVEGVAGMFIGKLTSNETLKNQLPNILARALDGNPTKKDKLHQLDQLLADNNITLKKIMYDHIPPCRDVVKTCRWQTMNIPCEDLFNMEVTNGRICCVTQSNILIETSKKAKLLSSLQVGQKVELALQCSNSTLHGCDFITNYDGELWDIADRLNPGSNYFAQVTFISISESSSTENVVEKSCVSEVGYSINECLNKCAEDFCGCANPLGDFVDNSTLPLCPIARLDCLQTNGLYNNGTCNCLPSCTKVTKYMTLESSPMNFVDYVSDPLYRGLNVTSSVVMTFRVNIGLSKTFILNPTETWLTLLSSLAGVFNMFLGVGLFSALELLTLVFMKFPMAIRRPSEIPPQHYNKM